MERIGESVGKELARSGGGSGATLGEITAVWPAAVGEPVSRQAWPLRIARDGTLHVATSSSTWAFELDRLSPEIEERLRALLGPATPPKLRFRVGPIPEPGAPAGELSDVRDEALEATPETVAQATTIAAGIEDPELRDLVARAAVASLARARSGRQI
jgi:hypothetical protein